MTEPRPVYAVENNGSDPGARIPLRITAQIHWLLLQLMDHEDEMGHKDGNGELRIVVREGKIKSFVPSTIIKAVE